MAFFVGLEAYTSPFLLRSRLHRSERPGSEPNGPEGHSTRR